MATIFPTEQEIEEFFTMWCGIVRAAAGAEVCAAIDAAFNPVVPPEEIEEQTWAEAQAWIEATSREAENFARRVVGEPEVDPWERANTQAHVEAIVEQAREMVENGQTIIL
jgi:hypothetical protein